MSKVIMKVLGEIMQPATSDLKQEIIRINNSLNISMYGTGLRRQRVAFLDEKVIVILADNKRITALASLDGTDRVTTRMVDIALLNDYKTKLKQELQQAGLSVKCVLKDYDHSTELAATVIVLE